MAARISWWHSRKHVSIAFLILLLMALLIISVESVQYKEYDDEEEEDDDDDDFCDEIGTCSLLPMEENECGLFLAPSTIPGAGLGIFVGSEKFEGDAVGIGDVAIPIIDVKFHHGYKQFFSPFDDYQWYGAVMGMAQENEDPDELDAFCPGLDCAINCNLALINVGKSMPQFDDGLHRYRNPGAGAITPYFNGTTYAVDYIPKGGELFKHYGNHWFKTRMTPFGNIPFVSHHEQAEEYCHRWHNMQNVSDAAKDDVWRIVKSFPWETRATNALPSTPEQARRAATEGIRSLYLPGSVREIDDLFREGRCMDNIQPGPSTIAEAGRGAFATRSFRAGQVITGSPMLHLYRSFFIMYHSYTDDHGVTRRNRTNVMGNQIMLNYCIGHAESTFLLCPYGSGVTYINHNQTLRNVRLEWAPDGVIAQTDAWLSMDPKTFEWNYSAHLAMDYVATRDIEKGEELFLDYGDHWEEAWQEHVANWKPREPMHYASAPEWNRVMDVAPLRTTDEQALDPYPDHILLRCHPKLQRKIWKKIFATRSFESLWDPQQKGWYCDIMRRHLLDGHYVYDVNMNLEDREGKHTVSIVRKRVPRKAMAFVDAKYSTDIHLKGAFRHEMHAPDEIWPEAWRNLEPHKTK